MPSRENKQDFGSTGSIFGQGDNPLFSDRKAMNVNDIVTVVISENAKSSNVGAKQLSETDNSKLGGGVFSTTGATTGTGANTRMTNYANTLNGYSNIGFNSDSTSSYKGSATATKDASFTTTVSARIVKVMQNGNYFISGKREILIDDQKQIIQISGVIRPYDIDQFNRIDSASMSDAKILYKTEGDVDRATKQGWGTKMVQSIWPF
jgi:flagellar L-ring protein precursor FlgH